MKKTAIVFAIILLISVVACIASGAAVGMETLGGYLHSGFDLTSINALDSLQELNGIDWYNETKQGKDKIHEETKDVILSKENGLTISGNVALIEVRPTENQKASAKLEIYSTNVSTSANQYKLETSQGNIRLTYSGPSIDTSAEEFRGDKDTVRRQSSRINTVLTIYLPKDQLNSLHVKMDTGMVSVKDLTLKELDVYTETGMLSVTGCTIGKAYLQTETGMLNAEQNTISQIISAKVETGMCRVVLPRDQGCNLYYAISAGTYRVSLENSSENGWSLGKKVQRNYRGGGYDASVTVNRGTLSIQTGD